MSSDQARDLRKQGIAAAKAGHKDEARQLLQRSLRLDAKNEAAWSWMLTLARDNRERLLFLSRLLDLNPQNELGQKTLQSLNLTPDQLAAQIAELAAPAPASAETSGVPFPDGRQLARLQAEAEDIVSAYRKPLPEYPGVKWVQKTKGRAGERDQLVLRTVVFAAGAVVTLLVLFGVYSAIINTPAVRDVLFVPTATFAPTRPPPTATPSPTPGPSLTPSPTPAETYTPSPTVPPGIADGRVVLPRATAVYPDVSSRALQQAIELVRQERYREALPTLQVEVTLVANSFDALPYYYQALTLAGLGDLEGALGILQEAERRLGERPTENYGGVVNAGLAYINLLKAERALEDNDSAAAAPLLSNVEAQAQAAIVGDPRLELPYLTLAQRYQLDRQYEPALAVLDQGLAIPDLASNVNLIVAKGEILFEMGRFAEAGYQAFFALYIDPTTETAYPLQVRSALIQQKPGDAVLSALNYVFYYPGSVRAYLLLGDARAAEGNTDLALLAYDQALVAGPDVPSLVARGELYLRLQQYPQANADFSAALAVNDDPRIRTRRMQAAFLAEDFATASADSEALRGQNAVSDAELNLLQTRILLHDTATTDEAAARRALELLTGIDDGLPADLRPVAAEYRAQAQFILGEFEAALQSITAALTSADTARRHYWRGRIHEALGDTEAALLDYDWVLTWSAYFEYPFAADARFRSGELRGGA